MLSLAWTLAYVPRACRPQRTSHPSIDKRDCLDRPRTAVWYPFAKQIALQLDLDLALTKYPSSPTSGTFSEEEQADEASPARLARRRHADGLAPELSLLCACLIAIKLVYFQRRPPPPSQPFPSATAAAADSRTGRRWDKSAVEGPNAVWLAVESFSGSDIVEVEPEVGEGVLSRSDWSALLRQMLETVEETIDGDRLASGNLSVHHILAT